ncbi:Rmf/CrpP family protein [Azospirillum himalayense]|uniref:Rmf/CrpP family protein n=1 Tax=Azospirillum himalayense TaxID=654847 RepID=A0ABW0GDE9_9PROT
MARKLNEKPAIDPSSISPSDLERAMDQLLERESQAAAANSKKAEVIRDAAKTGVRKPVFKALARLFARKRNDDPEATIEAQQLLHLIPALQLNVPRQQALFDEMPDAEAVAGAMEAVIGPDLSAIPNPPPPADFEGKKRKLGAWAKGCEARRNGEKRSDCLLTGAESVAIFEQAWDAMDAAIKAAAEGGQPASGASATVGSELPDGMSQDEHTALLAEGIKLFREGKAPGAHAYGDDPVKAGIVMKGWATEQDAQNAARATERAAEQAAEGGGQQSEQALSAEEVQALEAEGATACEAGEPQSACPHPAGSAKADAWLAGWERQDNALFDEAGPAAAEAPGESGEVVFADADDGDDLPDLPEDDEADVLMPAMASNGAADAFMAPAE